MKKLALKAIQFGAGEVLTRAQLKNVLGGDGSGGAQNCNSDADCKPRDVCGTGVLIPGVCKTTTCTCSWGAGC